MYQKVLLPEFVIFIKLKVNFQTKIFKNNDFLKTVFQNFWHVYIKKKAENLAICLTDASNTFIIFIIK